MKRTMRFALLVCLVSLAGLVWRGYAQQFGVGSPQPALTFQPGIITTLVGTGTSGDTGDGGPASSALVTNGIRGIAADAAGDVFFADDTNGTVRVVYEGGATAAALITAENPTVTTPVVGDIYDVAGTEGSTGTPATGTLATSNKLKPGAGLGLDAAGDLYFNDTGTNKVWAIYAGGTGTTGTNLISLEAGVATPTLGDIYAVAGNGTSGYTGDGGLAASAELHGVNDIKFDTAGDLFLVDQGNDAIREVSASTGIITTVAGVSGTVSAGSATKVAAAGNAVLNTPYGIAIDANGDFYIADNKNKAVKVVYEGGATAAALITAGNPTVTAPVVGDIYEIVGGGTKTYPYGVLGTAAELSGPTMVAMDAAGDLYIADNSFNVILEMNGTTGLVSVVAGNTTAGYSGDGGAGPSAELDGLRCATVDAAGRVYITDATNLCGCGR